MIRAQKSLLLIDGHLFERSMLRRTLLKESKGRCRILEADSGEQGLKLAEVSHVGCIILEWDLVDFSGEEVLATLLARCERLYCPVLIYAQSLDAGRLRRAKAYGAKAAYGKGQSPAREVALHSLRLIGYQDPELDATRPPIGLTSAKRAVFVPHYG